MYSKLLSTPTLTSFKILFHFDFELKSVIISHLKIFRHSFQACFDISNHVGKSIFKWLYITYSYISFWQTGTIVLEMEVTLASANLVCFSNNARKIHWAHAMRQPICIWPLFPKKRFWGAYTITTRIIRALMRKVVAVTNITKKNKCWVSEKTKRTPRRSVSDCSLIS